jgi:cell division septation protein DedD
VISVVIFLCGVLVGRGVRAQQAGDPADEAIAADALPQPAAAAAAPPSIEPPAPPAEDEDALSYTQRLRAETPPPETLKPQADPPREPPDTRPAPAPAAAPPAGARPGVWVVQLMAIRDRAAAASVVQRLQGKGYPAFLVTPAAGSPAPMFKVQVGRYDDRREAERVADRLKKEERFQPWIQR